MSAPPARAAAVRGSVGPLLLFALLSLAACGTAPGDRGDDGGLAALAAPALPPPADAVPPADPRFALLGRPPELRRLVGLSGERVAGLLGAPTFRRRDRPAEVWQYGDPLCVVDLFLYEDGGGAYTVAHAEARGRGGVRLGPEECLARILGARPPLGG